LSNSSYLSILAHSNLGPSLTAGPYKIAREWINVSDDLGLRFTIQNMGTEVIELGSVGFPTEFNSIFTDRTAVDTEALCSLSDPYVGMHTGYIRVSPLQGNGTALVVTPLGDTPLEAYRNLVEGYYDTAYGSQTFEGFYEWQVLTKAWAKHEWKGITPWNIRSSRTLNPGESVQFGVRFSAVKDGVRGIDDAIEKTGTPDAVGIPGYFVPRDLPAQLTLRSGLSVALITSDPAGALVVTQISTGSYTVTPSTTAWGRTRLTIKYSDGKTQTVHCYITKPGTEAVADL
jgi:hypothetical protein